jgi:hypothetical protein
MKQRPRPRRAAASHVDERSREAGAGRRVPPPKAPRAGAGRPVPPRSLVYLLPVLAVVVALAMRLWAHRYQAWVTMDGSEYIRFAGALLRGEPFPSIFPPGYPALIAGMHGLVSDRVAAADAVSIVCGVLLPWPVWVLARRVVGTWAWLPALAVALHPGLVRISVVSMSESAYFLALYGALALAGARSWGAGAALGAGFAIRPEALLPAAVLALGGSRSCRRGSLRPATLARAAAGFLVFAVPCWLYFHSTLGEWTMTPKVSALRTAVEWRQEEPRIEPRATAPSLGPVERVLRFGPDAVRRYPGRALQHGRSLLAEWPAPLLLLSLLGLWRRRGLASVPLLHLVAIPFLALSAQPRFVLSAIPALALLATAALACSPRGLWRGVLVALGISGLVWRGATAVPEFTRTFEGYLGAERDAGEWLSGVSGPGDAVMDRKPPVAFYADRPYRVIPDDPYERIIEYAQHERIRYLVLEQGVVRLFRPQLAPLLYDAGFREREGRLEMVYFGGHDRGYGVVIFRFLQAGERKTGRPPVMNLRWRSEAAAPR